MATNISSDVSK